MAAPAPPYTTLADIKAWLATLSVGTSVSVGATLFSDLGIQGIFTVIPDANPVALHITAVDSAAATLSGTTSLLGDAGTATFTFTEPDAILLTSFAFSPTGLSWTLLSDFNASFEVGSAVFATDPDTDVVGLSISADLVVGTAPDVMSLPITLAVPSVAGEWMLQAGISTPVPKLNKTAIASLAGGNDVMSILPQTASLPGNFSFDNFTLDDFEMAFNPVVASPSCSLIRVGLGYKANWSFFDGHFTVENLGFQFDAIQPFSKNSGFEATVYAEMQIGSGGPTIDVGMQFPEYTVFAILDPSTPLNLTAALEFFNADLPSRFPDIQIDTLSFMFYPSQGSVFFDIGITKPIQIIGSIALDNFGFEMMVTYTGGTFTAEGTLSAAFSLNQTSLSLVGSYTSSGLALAGLIQNVPLRQIITDIAARFGIQASDIPAPIRDLTLAFVRVDLNTGVTDSFTFAFDATTTVAGVNVDFYPTITMTHSDKGWSVDFGGTLRLVTRSGEIIDFGLTFAEDAASKQFSASYSDSGNGLTFEDIAGVFGLSLTDVPPDLDLDLTKASFTYDSATGLLAFALTSKNYGEAVFISVSNGSARTQVFILDANQSFSLSNLPLIGHDLAAIEDIQLQNLTAIIASATIDASQAASINAAIAKLGSGYPQLPTTGVASTLLLSAQLAMDGQLLPLVVPLGDGSGGATSADRAVMIADNNALAATVGFGNDGGTVWFAIQKSFGPVSLQRIGALYQPATQTLWFEIDASVAFGPMTLTMEGLGIGSPLTSFDPQFSLAGFGLQYQAPPLTIGGAFASLAPPGAQYVEFEGGVTVATGDFSLEAFGYYGNRPGFPSLFLYGDIGYPLGGPPAFFVTGLSLGLGYNSDLRLPSIDEIPNFPFVQVLPGSTSANPGLFGNNPTPLTVLDTILQTTPPWVSSEAGQIWLSAGITFTTYELLNSQAMVVVEFGGADGLEIALLGTSRAQFPQTGDIRYAYVELDLDVRFMPAQGVFSLEAALARSSFLLDPACLLTGGFAFYVWYDTSPYEGDFVLSLGGYNSGFVPPDYYPSVPAVSFNWSLDSSISVVGSAYLALTPSVLMIGGRLNATYQTGNLKAWFDAHADVTIRWKPFWIDAGVGITVGASYKLDLLFTSVTFSVELGCDLELWGPPTGGCVSVDWYIISFTIYFGSSKSSGQSINGWSDVEAMLPNAAANGGQVNIVKLAPVAGLANSTTAPSAGAGAASAMLSGAASAPWKVRASRFAFSTSAATPISQATVGGAHSFTGGSFNVHPLTNADNPAAWTGVTASHSVTIEDDASNDYSASFQVTVQRSNMPASLWGSPPEGQNGPLVPSADEQLVQGQISGLSITVNPPQLGGSAGPIDVRVNLSTVDLELPEAILPVSNLAVPQGPSATVNNNCVGIIADPASGIAAPTTQSARLAVFNALQTLSYAPQTSNSDMSAFAGAISCALASVPLLVAASG
ncbi:MAG: hypothetical protein HEQ34_01615 [Sphingorhabdus sp.]|uniref:DUF6603 domain-containing protein n=1 Tax=Sphingorhabdus sp. TaxID=1902408 RepID=UPI0025F57212|nr:DUF6603 domain-containing protein [Sphingorhabdus sp.]MCO4090637.1 hypothetical protein [Sphingorhabdus sp.]